MVYKKNYILLSFCIVILFLLSLYFFQPQVEGDTVSYIEAIDFLKNGESSDGFIFNRMITTFGALWTLIALSAVFGLFPAWLGMNFVFYALAVFVFYKIMLLLFESKRTSLFGAVFLAGNYAALRFGPIYLMDIGGWAFYIFSIYFTFKYSKSNNRKDLLWAAVLAGVGGLFKEYAFLALIPITFFLIYENRRSLINLIRNSFLPAILTIGPIALVYLYAYLKFSYTYLDWFSANKTFYRYDSRAIEYIKSLGSLINILAYFFIGGLAVLRKEWSGSEIRLKLFLISIFVSFLPIFIWPAITQRILFITVPFTILISGFFIKKHEKYWYAFIPILVIYILASFFMDSFILNSINLPI